MITPYERQARDSELGDELPLRRDHGTGQRLHCVMLENMVEEYLK